MANLKNTPDLFLGDAEISKFKDFLDTDGWRKYLEELTVSFGIVDNSKDGNFINGLVEVGTNAETLKVNPFIAIDSNFQFIRKLVLEDNIPLADDSGAWFWVKIKYAINVQEAGLVSISSNGDVSGVGTAFTSLLRGKSNFMSNIRFPNSILNTGIYQVADVIDGTNIIIQGDLQDDPNQEWSIAGTFTPGVVITASNRESFEADGNLLTIVAETVLETEPTFIAGEEFFLARVRNLAGVITVQDVRSRFIYQTKADWNLTNVDNTTNNLIGVESVKFDDNFTPRERNIVYMGWGFRSSNFTVDSNTNQVTINGGEGGKFKSTEDFTNGDFNGWRIYTEDGTYQIIQSSALNATQINLSLDTLDFSKYANASQELIIVPNADEIKIIALTDSTENNELVEKEFLFPIKQAIGKCPLVVYEFGQTSNYVIKYTNKLVGVYGPETLIPTDLANGYFDENSFDQNGNLLVNPIERTRVPYTAAEDTGFIFLKLATDAYRIIIDSLAGGDAAGVETQNLNNLTPLIEWQSGVNPEQQFFDQRAGTFQFTVDIFIDVLTKDVLNQVVIEDGVGFTIQFNSAGQLIDLNGFTLKLVTGFVNPGNPGTEIFNFTQEFLDFAKTNDARIRIYYDVQLDEWLVYEYNLYKAHASRHLEGGTDAIDNATTIVGGLLSAADKTILDNLAGASSNLDDLTDVTISAVANAQFLINDGAGQWKNQSISGDIVISNTGVATIQPDAVGSGEIADNAIGVSEISTAIAGNGLAGGGGSALSVNVDGTTIEINSDTLRIAASAAGNGLGGGGASALSINVDGTTIEINADALRVAASAAGAGLGGGGASALSVNVDGTTIEINSDTLRIKDAGITTVKLATATQEFFVQNAGNTGSFTIVKTKILEIGDWNMDTGTNVTIAHGLGVIRKNIRSVDVIIRDDLDNLYNKLEALTTSTAGTIQQGGVSLIDSTNITLRRITGGLFDSTVYDSTSFNRGWIYITYEE